MDCLLSTKIFNNKSKVFICVTVILILKNNEVNNLEFDECKTGQHGCQHKCVNTLGGFKCECDIGYELHIDGKSCEGKVILRINHLVNTSDQ